ncbi:MAG: OmpA family protein [Gammaproteobacteria bacterium]|nr:MAG: OmpA family protein [Gammaproteobacteria bacterium]
MSKALILFLGLLLLAILGYFCIYNNSSRIQIDIDARTRAVLTEHGLDNITVGTDGREIVLTGLVSNEVVRRQAEEYARKVYGVRTVDNKLSVAAPEPVVEPDKNPEPVKKVIQQPKLEVLPEFTCQQDFNALLSSNGIHFATNSADIDPSSNRLLNDLIEVANQCPEAKIEIGGHTDSSGSNAHNLRLSQARASSVMDYLAANEIDAIRLTAVGYGENNPIADNESDEGKAKNRRIEFNVKGLSQ